MRWGRLWWWLLCIPLVFGLARLRFDAEVMNLLPQGLSLVQGLRSFQEHFSNARELIITVAAPDAEKTKTAANILAQQLRSDTNLVANVSWQPGWLEDPAQAAEFLAALWINQPPSVFSEVSQRLAVTNLTKTLQETRERLATTLSPKDLAAGAYDPYGLTRLPDTVVNAAPAVGSGEEMFASPEGTFRLLYVGAQPDLADYRACRSWLTAIQGIVAQARRSGQWPAEVEVRYTGRPAFVAEISSGMEQDMAGSSGSTLGIIGLLFWLTHRRVRPLMWLLSILAAILVLTLALGGLCFGTINVVSMGFASILMGLAEDFGIIIYQESRSHPELNVLQLRREVAPGILWSALTTGGAFLTLNLSALPGLGQLGTLVAMGIGGAAVLMLYAFLPVLLRLRRKVDLTPEAGATRERFLLFQPLKPLSPAFSWWATALLVIVAVAILGHGGVRLDRSPNVLEPQHSEAMATLEGIQRALGQHQEALWVMVPGANEEEVGLRLDQVDAALRQAVANHSIAAFTLPTVLWPQPGHQVANRASLASVIEAREPLRVAAREAGFTTNALFLTEHMLTAWERAAASTNVFWPTNRANQWLLNKVFARTSTGFLALGLVYPSTNAAPSESLAANWPSELESQGIRLSGWSLLGATIFEKVMGELPFIIAPIFLLVLASLWLAFRSLRETLLSLATLAVSGLFLGAAMHLLGWKWNLMNIMALPLIMGMGVDFSIHVQLALRRHGGDRLEVRRSVGRALLLAGTTTVAGFGSLAFSTNTGISSLGQVCALGIALAMVTAVYLLPVWWAALPARPRTKCSPPGPRC